MNTNPMIQVTVRDLAITFSVQGSNVPVCAGLLFSVLCCLQVSLVRAECMRYPLAAGINVGGHYKWHFLLLSLSTGSLLILPDVGFQNFAWVGS